MRLVLHRRSAWMLAAGLGLAVLSGCNRGGPEQGSLNEGTATPDDMALPPSEPLNIVEPTKPANAVVAQDRIIEPDVSSEEQVLDDAEATGMTARTHDGLVDGPSAQPVETAGETSGRRADPLATPVDTSSQSGNAAQVQGQ